MDLGLEGHVAIVTGASRGLGRAISLALAREGVHVLGVARSESDLEDLRIESNDAVAPYVADMADLSAIPRMVDFALQRFGRLDIVVNNAGIAPASPTLDQSLEEWERTLTVNLTAPAELAKAAGRHMASQGSGKIINVASTSGIRGKATLAGYSASKGGLIRFTEALAGEWARHGIQVNAIAPGAFETDAQQKVLESSDLLEKRLRKIPARRMGTLDEIGPITCLLASPLSDFVTGAVFVIDGGEVSRL